MNKHDYQSEFLNKCSVLFEEYETKCFLNPRESQENAANEFYTKLKELSYLYYKGKNLPFSFRYLSQEIVNFEGLLPSNYIVSIMPHDFSKSISKPKTLANPELVLDYIIDKTRNYLYDYITFDERLFSYESCDLQNECKNAVDFINGLAMDLGIDFQKILICPAFSMDWGYEYSGVHYFTILFIHDKAYIVDPTYSQFCLKKRCNLIRLGTPLVPLCAPGTFMLYDKTREDVLNTILKKGYIECTDTNLKAYMDGFLVSFRNGLYYEHSNDYSFETNYTASDYKAFLNGTKSLFDYGRPEELGYQLRPLDNPYIKIRHKSQL